MKDLKIINEYSIVRKAEAVVNARYAMSITAIKIITTIVSQIEKRDTELQRYTINVRDMAKKLGVKENGSTYKQFKDACEELMSKIIKFEDKYGWEMTTWLASAKYVEEEGIITIQISEMLKPVLIELKNGKYLNYELKNVLGLKSSYIIRLYETLKHEHNINKKYRKNKVTVYEMKIDELRERFEIPKSYQFRDIRERIIDKAVKEFKEHTDIKISWEVSRKVARKVVAIEFTIIENGSVKPHLKTLGAFIKHLKKWYVNETLIENENEDIKISKMGLLYNNADRRQKNYTKRKAEEIFIEIYERAKSGKPIGIEDEIENDRRS